MILQKPKKLNKKDVIGIISPASSPDELSRIQSGVKYLESLGYRVKVGTNVGKNHGYLAGTDQERVDDIHSMFKDKNVKAIFTLRGGYGAFRLLDKIDYRVVKNNRNYSDEDDSCFHSKIGLGVSMPLQCHQE